MERLTERFDGWVMRKGCHGPCRTCDGAGCDDIYPMIDRLAAYEDTGLEPKEVKVLLPPPNSPLTLANLREMAWKQTPVWCNDTDGIHAGLLCIQDDWYTSERTPHIWLLDEEGHPGVYSVQSLIQAGATFYRHRPEAAAE